MDDYLDRDAVLFGGDDPPSDGSFDPFLPGLSEEGSTSFRGDDSADTAVIHQFPENSGGYEYVDDDGYTVLERSHNGSDRIDKSDDDRSLPWEGAGNLTVHGAAERAAREAADAGNRNIRRVAESHDRSVGAGADGNGKTHSTGVDSSISAAAQRIRSEIAGPVDTGRRSAAIAKFAESGHLPLGPRQYQKQGVTAPPRFMSTEFEAMLTGLKANVSGDWILTLKIEQSEGDKIFPLHSAFGLALDVHVDRHVNRSND